MRYNDNPLMEPIFFTPPSARRVGAPGSRRLHKGGSSGGTPYYANQDKLAGVQADIASNLYNQYAAYSPQVLEGLSTMASEAGSGLYTQQLRDRALADSAAAAGMQNRASERQLSSMGVNPNDPRFAGTLRATGLENAAMMAKNANAAGNAGDDMAWARQQDLYNSLAGMPSQSATMLASAGNSYGNLGNQMQTQANANAQGYGQFGAQIANSMFAADGGYVEEPGYASGGSVAGQGMPQLGDWRQRPASWSPQSMSTMDKVGAVATPVVAGMAANAAGKGMSALGSAAWNSLTSQAAAPVVEAAITPMATTAAGTAGTAAGTGLAAGTAGTAAAGTGAAAAGTGAAAGAAGSGAMAAMGTAMPWVGAALLAAHALDLFADGGEVGGLPERKDLRAGGPVPGLPLPQAPDTSDHVPAWVTPKEYVLNTHATEMVGKRDLEAVNNAGLAKRNGVKTDKAQRAKAAVRRIKAKAKAARKGA